MKKTLLFTALLLTMLNAKSQNYYAVSPNSDTLYNISVTTGAYSNEGKIEYDNGTYSGFTGMARDPLSPDIYVIVKKSGGISELAKFNSTMDSVLNIGTLSDKFAGLTFNSNGLLYGITGFGANVNPSTLYTINTSTAASTLVVDLSSTSTDGEAIAFNSSDGLIYRFTGQDTLQSINTSTLATINYPFSNTVANFGHALTYRSATNDFVMVAGDTTYSVSVTGVLTDVTYTGLGDLQSIKGITEAPMIPSVPNLINNSELVDIYPNPSVNGLVTIKTNNNMKAINVFSMNGQLIESSKVNFKQVVTKKMKPGSYMVEVILDNNVKNIKRVLVK